MLKQDRTLQIINKKCGFQKDKKKVTGLMKDESGRKTITTFVGLRSKTYSYLIDEGNEDKKAIATKKCVIKKT